MEKKLNNPKLKLQDKETLNLKRYVSMFISNWYWFAVTFFIAVTIAYGINRYSERIYIVSSALLIKDDQSGSINNVESVIPGGDIFKSRQNLINEIGILKSFSLNDSVIRKLEDFNVVYMQVGRRGIVESKKYRDCPFKVIYDSIETIQTNVKVGVSILSDSTLKIELNNGEKIEDTVNFGEAFIKPGFKFKIIKRYPEISNSDFSGSNRYSFYFIDPTYLANEYRNKLTVAPTEKEASLVNLSVWGPVPEQEADYLNMLMDVYIQYGLNYKNRTAANTIDFINKQIKIISDSLKIAEEKLEAFRKINNFFDLSREGAQIQNRLEKLENEKTAFDLQLQYYQYLSNYLKDKTLSGALISPSIMGIDDPILIKLVSDYSELKSEREKLGFNIDLNQPALELIERQILNVEEALMENVRNGISGLSNSILNSDEKISGIESEINTLPSTERGLINIQRKFDLNNTVYTYLLEKRAESGIAKASNIPDNRIIDKASRLSSTQILPKPRNNYVIAFILAFLLPMTWIILVDFFNDKIIDKNDVESKTNVPVIGYISHSSSKGDIPVMEKPRSSFAESFRSVRTSLKYFIKDNSKPVIAVSSTISAEGKTFISVNLAVITAMLGKKVLLIGLDMRKPRINKVFNYESGPGISTYLSGNSTYEDVVSPTQIDNLSYTPSGPVPPNPAELIDTLEMQKFIDRAKTEFDYIIIDTPPVAIVTDALLLAPYIDLNLFVVRQRYTSRHTLEMIEQLYQNGELKNMAIVINDINLSGYYGYGMRYGYALGYGYSYGYNYYGKGNYGRYGYTDKSSGYYKD
jgi:tyrosine-protein kinase Etk/Wzc